MRGWCREAKRAILAGMRKCSSNDFADRDGGTRQDGAHRMSTPPPLDAQVTLHGGLVGSLKVYASLGDPPVPPASPDNFGRVARIMEILNDVAEFAKTVWEAIGPYLEPLLFRQEVHRAWNSRTARCP